MPKVVYNDCHGGFGLSNEVLRLGKELSGDPEWDPDKYSSPITRHDPILIKVVETLGKSASSDYANVKIAMINGNKYRIEEYDGAESVVEPDDLAWIVVEGKGA